MRIVTGGGQEPTNSPARYRIAVAREHPVCITATDRRTGTRICGWRGPVALQLLDSGILSAAHGTVELFEVDKAFLQHLALAAASAQMALDRATAISDPAVHQANSTGTLKPRAEQRWCRLDARLRRLNTTLDGTLKRVAQLLFSYPGKHFSTADVCCLLAMQGLPVGNREVGAWLDELAARGITQRINVGADRVFHDIDTRPHLHIYDRETGELRDATVHGVITSGSRKLPASLEVAGNNLVRIRPVHGIESI